jgi:hypothetical protein
VGVNNFPDGVAPDAVGSLPNPPAPEALLPELHGEAQFYGGPKGIQPITATNPDGDVAGIPFSVRPSRD